MVKNKENSQKEQITPWYVFLAMGIIIGGIIFSFIPEDEVIIEVEKEQPMLLVMFDSWGENIDDSSEAIFSYFIYNFGDIEAKNVSIRCEILSIDERILKEEIFNVGNIASSSYEYQESYMEYSSNVLEEYGICYLHSANGEYIDLIENLDDLE